MVLGIGLPSATTAAATAATGTCIAAASHAAITRHGIGCAVDIDDIGDVITDLRTVSSRINQIHIKHDYLLFKSFSGFSNFHNSIIMEAQRFIFVPKTVQIRTCPCDIDSWFCCALQTFPCFLEQ